MTKFWSEDSCDRWISENLVLPQKGFYVDVGCAHPWKYSQTAFLRERGWNGLVIDGNPDYEPEWKGISNAEFISAVISNHPHASFLNEKTNALVSRIHEQGKEMPAFKLSYILRLKNVSQIDFMSLDIEASEIEAFMDLVTEAMLPRVLVAEFNSAHAGRNPLLIELILRAGYEFRHMTDCNGVFVK